MHLYSVFGRKLCSSMHVAYECIYYRSSGTMYLCGCESVHEDPGACAELKTVRSCLYSDVCGKMLWVCVMMCELSDDFNSMYDCL